MDVHPEELAQIVLPAAPERQIVAECDTSVTPSYSDGEVDIAVISGATSGATAEEVDLLHISRIFSPSLDGKRLMIVKIHNAVSKLEGRAPAEADALRVPS